MLCCMCCKSKRDYKVASTDAVEMEPLGGEMDKDKDGEKTNGHQPEAGNVSQFHSYRTILFIRVFSYIYIEFAN